MIGPEYLLVMHEVNMKDFIGIFMNNVSWVAGLAQERQSSPN